MACRSNWEAGETCAIFTAYAEKGTPKSSAISAVSPETDRESRAESLEGEWFNFVRIELRSTTGAARPGCTLADHDSAAPNGFC